MHRVRLLFLFILLTAPSAAHAITVDPANSSWFVRADGSPFFMCGPGDPEGFLYEGNQEDLIDKLAGTGANAIYLQAVRSHGGDGERSHNPFVDYDPDRGINQNILDRWEAWFSEMDDAGITIFFIFYDDSACPWGDCRGAVGAKERAFIETLVNAFEHHDNLIWAVAEEYSEAFSKAHVSEVAGIIRAADDRDHPIANHQQAGVIFDHANDPALDQFAIQLSDASNQPNHVHEQVVEAWRNARGRYNLNMAELEGMARGDSARRQIWAAAMGGAYVMVYEWFIRDTPEVRLKECGYVVDFFEQTNVHTIAPHDELAEGSADYVLANPGKSYVAYTGNASGEMGVRGLEPDGTYALRWLDTISGAMREERVVVDGVAAVWPAPADFSKELALSVERVEYNSSAFGQSSARECNLLSSANASALPQGFGAPWNTLSAAHELLISVTCTEGEAGVSVGALSGSAGQAAVLARYVYRFGYTYRGGRWQQIAFQGANLEGGAWYVGQASAELPHTAEELTENNFVVAYVCQWTGSQWKCGCRDSACAQSQWQLQAFRR